MRLLVLGLATLALSAGVALAQPATPVYPRYGYAPHGYGYAYGYEPLRLPSSLLRLPSPLPPSSLRVSVLKRTLRPPQRAAIALRNNSGSLATFAAILRARFSAPTRSAQEIQGSRLQIVHGASNFNGTFAFEVGQHCTVLANALHRHLNIRACHGIHEIVVL